MNDQSPLLDPARHWGIMLAAGIFAMLLGAVAIARPMTSSVEIELLVGLILVASGAADFILAIVMRQHEGFWSRLLPAVGAVAIGVFLLRAPLAGLLTITLVLAAYFVFQGTVRIVEAVRARGKKGWVLRLVGGIAAALLGVLVFHGWPVDAAWAIGLLVGLNLVIGGAVTAGIAIAFADVEDTVRDRVQAVDAAMAA